MRDRSLSILAALLIVLASLSLAYRHVRADDSLSGQWTLERTGDGVQLTLRYHHGGGYGFNTTTESHREALSSFKGLDLHALESAGTQSQFDVIRDAGTFHCKGWFAHGSASGEWTFTQSPQFAEALVSKGVGRPDLYQTMRLAMGNAQLQLVDRLKQAGYSFDVENLIKAVNHGVDLEYVRGMADLGYKPDSLQDLIRMRDHGVDPEYVNELVAAGLGKLPASEVVRMRDHGVDAEYIRGLKRYGITNLSGDELAKLRDHGVDPEYIAGMQAVGINTSPQDWIRLRDHGVDPEYAKDLRSAGLNASAEDMIHLRDHGVDADYVRHYGKGHSAAELIQMHDHGVRATI